MPDVRPATAVTLQPLRNAVGTSFLYPFKGIYYFSKNREFWPLFGRQLIPLTIISVVVLALLFAFTYLPQALFLLPFHGPTAWFNAVFLVLGEGQVLVALLFEGFMVDETLVNVFDVCSCPADTCFALRYGRPAPLIFFLRKLTTLLCRQHSSAKASST